MSLRLSRLCSMSIVVVTHRFLFSLTVLDPIYLLSPPDTLLVACALFAKGLAVSLFCGMNLYAVELFPTIVRGTAIGICGFSARVGSLLAPQLMLLGDLVAPWCPMVIIGGALMTAGLTLFMLPETKTIQIPNTVEDANRLWAKNKPPRDTR